jgi:hypothetical protein
MIMICGFNMNDLGIKEGNIYVKMVEKLVDKLSFFVDTIVKIVNKCQGNFSDSCKNLLEKYHK